MPRELTASEKKFFWIRMNRAIINSDLKEVKLIVKTFKDLIHDPSQNTLTNIFSSGDTNKRPIDVSIRGISNDTLLHITCAFYAIRSQDANEKNKLLSIIKYLISEGADINAIDNEGFTPLHAAILNTSSYGAARLLLENGADANAIDNSGYTPLHLVLSTQQGSISKKIKDFVRLLIREYGANIFIEDKSGKTPLDIVQENGITYTSRRAQNEIFANRLIRYSTTYQQNHSSIMLPEYPDSPPPQSKDTIPPPPPTIYDASPVGNSRGLYHIAEAACSRPDNFAETAPPPPMEYLKRPPSTIAKPINPKNNTSRKSNSDSEKNSKSNETPQRPPLTR